MVSSNNSINDTVGASISGVTNTLTVTNPSNTASSGARETITVGGASAADPSLNFNVNGVTDFEMGIDNNDSDNFKISASASLGTMDTFTMTSSGERRLPLQPAYCARLASNDNNVTGAGTSYQLGTNVALTEIFDQGGDFNTNGTFTAPITGQYVFNGCLALTAPSGSNRYRLQFTTSNRVWSVAEFNATNALSISGHSYFALSILCDMDAADTLVYIIFEDGAAGDTADIIATTAAGQKTYVSGYLCV